MTAVETVSDAATTKRHNVRGQAGTSSDAAGWYRTVELFLYEVHFVNVANSTACLGNMVCLKMHLIKLMN